MTVIYHHTTTEGLIGILDGHSIWATDIGFLNDYEEFVAGIREIERVCEQNPKSLKGTQHHAFGEYIYAAIRKLIIVNLAGRSSYIASFTETRDNLRQWMSYGRPNASYSIGFNREKLKIMSLDKMLYRSPHLAYTLENVAYGSNTAIEQVLSPQRIVELMTKTEGAPKPDDVQEIVSALMFGVCSVKRQEFLDEAEVRMIFQTRKMDVPYEGTRFRNWGGVVVPYISIEIPMDSIEEIIIGPNINREIAKAGLEKLLKKNQIDCVISHSKCTLRQH